MPLDRLLGQKLQGAWLLLAPAAPLLYSLYRYLYLSAPIADSADLGGDERLTIPGFPLLQAILKIGPDNPILPYNLMDIAFSLLTIVLVVGIALKLRSTPYTLYSVAFAIANLSVYMDLYLYRPAGNSPRRLLLIFPIFILLALVTSNRRIYRMVVFTSAAFYLIMAGLFTNWIFIS